VNVEPYTSSRKSHGFNRKGDGDYLPGEEDTGGGVGGTGWKKVLLLLEGSLFPVR